MTNKLPSRLGKEPLIDAVFEIRFNTTGASAADIMPGYLHAKLGGNVKIERLPIAQLPLEIRQKDPSLANQPLIRITWNNLLLIVGDRSLAVACLMPYPGWSSFRDGILKVVNLLSDSGIVHSLERYSLKYVDMLAINAGDAVGDWVSLDVNLGAVALESQPFQLHMEIESNGFSHGLLVGSPAQSQGLDGVVKNGMIISVDTAFVGLMPELTSLIENLPQRIDEIHSCNKTMFFNCLTVGAIKKLEPEYV